MTLQQLGPVTALVIGDPHFKISNVRETDAMVEAIISVAQRLQPDIIIDLGDTLDRHESIHVSPLTRAVKFLARLKEIAPTYLLIGNHDLKNNRQFLSDEHPFTALKYWGPNMTVVDAPVQTVIKGQTFTFVPYVPPGRYEEALNQLTGWMNSSAIFGHQELFGAQMGAIISTEGDIWPLTRPYTILGHIHDYHELQPNAIYVGTPIQHAFGDRHDKTVSFFTFNSATDRSHERIDLGLVRKFIVRLNCGEVSTYIPRANSELKIIISGTSGEIKAIMKHPNIDIWKRAGYKITYKDIPLNSPVNNSIDQIFGTDGPVISKAPRRYRSVLYDTVKSQQRMVPIYTGICGAVQITDGRLTLNIKQLEPINNESVKVLVPKVETTPSQKPNIKLEIAPQRVRPKMEIIKESGFVPPTNEPIPLTTIRLLPKS